MPNHTMLDATTEPTGPSEEGLVVNIIQFSHLLRENGISVTLSSVLDAIHGLEFIDISNLKSFRGLLQLNFVYRKDNINLFDQLFFLFWFSEQHTGLQIQCDGGQNEELESDSPSQPKKESVDYGNPDRNTT